MELDDYTLSRGENDAFHVFVSLKTGQTVEFWCLYLNISPDTDGRRKTILQRGTIEGKPFLTYIDPDDIAAITVAIGRPDRE